MNIYAILKKTLQKQKNNFLNAYFYLNLIFFSSEKNLTSGVFFSWGLGEAKTLGGGGQNCFRLWRHTNYSVSLHNSIPIPNFFHAIQSLVL